MFFHYIFSSRPCAASFTVKKKEKKKEVKITKEDSEKYDTVYVELETSKHNKITIGTVDRPPKQQAADDAALYEEIHTITQNKETVIIGDFNCSNID